MPYHQGPPRFYYRHWISEDPRSVVLLLHGFGEHSGLFHRFAAELTRAGNEVWCLDHVGHGLSGDHDGMFESIGQLAINAELLLDKVQEAQPSLPLFVIGHSLGGLTAVEVASRWCAKLAGVVLSGPPVVGRPDVLPDKPIFSRDPSYIDDIRHDPLAISSSDAEGNLWRAVEGFVAGMPPLVGTLNTPTLVIFGEHDVFTTPDEAQRWTHSLPQGRLWVVPGGYHDILQDTNHRLVASEICRFVDEQVHVRAERLGAAVD